MARLYIWGIFVHFSYTQRATINPASKKQQRVSLGIKENIYLPTILSCRRQTHITYTPGIPRCVS